MENSHRNKLSLIHEGQGLAEYALLLSFIAVVLIGVLAVLTSSIGGTLEDVLCSLYTMGREIECGQADPGDAVVNEPPTADFSVSCSGLTCSFNGTSSSDSDGTIEAYEWSFGDGATATTATATHTYATDGVYTVVLRVLDDGGAYRAKTSPVTAGTVNTPPLANFTFSCSGLTCNFDASTSSDSDGTITSYTWNFGGGATATGVTTSYTYGSSGSYTVALTVTDNLGASRNKNQTVTAAGSNVPPVASFTVTCTGNTCNFDASASTDSDGTIASYAWDFGDGGTGAGATTSRTYAGNGNYTVVLVVTDDEGAAHNTSQIATVGSVNANPSASFTVNCSGLTCSVDASASGDSDGTITSFAWAFGDGNSGSGMNTSHTYATPGSYTISLTVTDDDGATASAVRTANAATPGPPTASFTVSCTGLTCSFNAGASIDDGTIVSYAWDFGDGSTGSGVTTNRTYATASGYTITLTVTDDLGLTSSTTRTASPAINNPPTASFTVNCVDLTCSFNASASNDTDGTIASYSWNFGDGSAPGSGVNPSHTYASAGNRTVTLTVTDNDGATSSVTNPANTTAANVPPIASFTVSCSGMTCTFNASASDDPDGSITGYSWNFGDGNTGSGVSASRTYTTTGAKTVTLTVTDNSGATTSVTNTANPSQPTMHISALSGVKTGEVATNPGKGNWHISVTITVQSNSGTPLNNVTVSGSVSGTNVSCTTSGTGQCTVTRTDISKNTSSVTYTVSNLLDNSGTHSYNAANNATSSVTINK